jgi:uroporphyrinogen-III synthase
VARLLALQQPAIALPLLRIEPAPEHVPLAVEAWQTLAARRLVMFVSPNAVAQFFGARPEGVCWPEDTLAGATGMGTVAALQSFGVPLTLIVAPSAQSPQFDAEALWSQCLITMDWRGQRVLFVRGEQGRDWLTDVLKEHGAEVQAVCAYQRLGPLWDESARGLLAQIELDPVGYAWLFSSSEAIRYLASFLDASGAFPRLRGVEVIATHERIAQTAHRLGFTSVCSAIPDPARVVDALRGDRAMWPDRYNRASAVAPSLSIAP